MTTSTGKTLQKFFHARAKAFCRINKTHAHVNNLFNGRVHNIIMCKHPSRLDDHTRSKKFLFSFNINERGIGLYMHGLFKGRARSFKDVKRKRRYMYIYT